MRSLLASRMDILIFMFFRRLCCLKNGRTYFFLLVLIFCRLVACSVSIYVFCVVSATIYNSSICTRDFDVLSSDIHGACMCAIVCTVTCFFSAGCFRVGNSFVNTFPWALCIVCSGWLARLAPACQ